MYEEDEYEEHYSFVGECICDHEREEHSWGLCGVETGSDVGDVCPCEAGWEE